MNSEIRKYFAGERAGQRILVCFAILVASIVVALILVEDLWGDGPRAVRQLYRQAPCLPARIGCRVEQGRCACDDNPAECDALTFRYKDSAADPGWSPGR